MYVWTSCTQFSFKTIYEWCASAFHTRAPVLVQYWVRELWLDLCYAEASSLLSVPQELINSILICIRKQQHEVRRRHTRRVWRHITRRLCACGVSPDVIQSRYQSRRNALAPDESARPGAFSHFDLISTEIASMLATHIPKPHEYNSLKNVRKLF